MLQPGRLGLDPVTDEEMEHMEARLRKNYRKMGNTDKWSGFARVDFPFQSAATAPTCPDTCSTCSDQFLPKFSRGLSDCFPMRMHDDEQAASLIADLIHSTKENHAYVRAKIDEYGNAISRRWKKKSVTKRTELLQTAKPNIYPKKRALIELMFETTDFANATSLGENAHLSHDEHRAEHWKHGETYLTPYLDAQSLSEEPLRLLAMMHYRSHTDQADWISFDREQCHIGFQTCHIQSAYNPHCVTVCGENFGKLVQWDKNAAHRWDTIGYPFARLIFKAQHRISDFLREIVDLLLQNEIDKAPRGRDEWDDLVASAFKQKKSYIGKSAYCEQAFSAAPSFDAERIVKLFRPRLNAASDQLWQMQTDPIYARHIVDRMLLLEHLSRLNKREQQAKQSVAPLRSVIRTEIWVCLHAEAETLLKVQEIYGDRIRPGTPLPKLYEMAMDRLELHLKYMFDLQVRLLNHLAMCLPTFRHHVTHESGNTYRITTLPRVSFYEDPLFWNLSEFREYDYCLNPAASMYFSWIDEILYNSSDMKRIDQELHDHLSDMAAVDEAVSAIKYHRSREGLPRSPKDFEKMSRDIGLSEDYGIMVTNWAWCTLGTPRIEEAFRSFMNLPLPSKKVDQGTLTQYKDLHDALSNYWAEVRVEMKAKLSQFPDPSERFLKLPIDRISASLSTEYRENIEQEQEYLLKEIETNERQLAARKAQNTNVPSLPNPFSTSSSTHTEAIAGKPEPKTKVKSRPTLARDSRDNDELPTNQEADPASKSPSLIEVSAKHLPLFSNMFCSSLFSKGRTKWDTLVAAMVDAGCSATHTGGSAVTFADESNHKGSITIHRPHPDSTFDPIELRSVGKRVTKWFGWNQNTFVEREKQQV